jgi:hypothetical protein
MTTQRRVSHYLLLLALLAGQWLYATHTHSDGTLDSDHHCQLCLHGVQFKTFLPVVELQPPAQIPQHVFIAPVAASRLALHSRFHDPRAPPHG